MPFENFLSKGNIQKHKTSKQEISDLYKLIKRDLKDASIEDLSADRRFTIAYNAILQCATIIMHCLGYRTKGEAHHYYTFAFLREALGSKDQELIDYFDACRFKRNKTDYDVVGEIAESEVRELLGEAKKFYKFTKDWVGKKYSQYL